MKIGNLLILFISLLLVGCSKKLEPNINDIQNKNLFENKENWQPINKINQEIIGNEKVVK